MANVQINPAQSALQNLLNLVDSQNTLAPTTPSQVTTSNLTSVTVGSISSDPTADTSVELDAASGQSRYSGSVVVYYTRESVSNQVSAVGGSVTIPTGVTDAATILSLVNTHYGFIPGEISWVSPPSAPSSGLTNSGTIQASGSLVYGDGQATVSLTWPGKTVLLMHFDGANGSTTFTDAVGHAVTRSGTGPAISTTQSKFGGASVTGFSGAGSYLSTPDAAELRLSDNFTIEFWAYPTSTSDLMALFKGPDAAAADVATIEFYNGALYIKPDGASGPTNVGGSLTANAWHHVAVTKSGSTWTAYVAGAKVGTLTSSAGFGTVGGALVIGNHGFSSLPFAGYIDELRISSVVRYTVNFTPATTAFTLD